MSIQRFRGTTLQEALERAETTLGSEPLVLWQSRELKSWLGQTYYELLAARRGNDGRGEPTQLGATPQNDDGELKRTVAPWMSPFEWREAAAWVFCGLSGAGKTSAMVKLAAALKRQGISPSLVSRDFRKIAGSAELAHFSRQLGLDFSCEPRLPQFSSGSSLFIDTPGLETIPQEETLRICREIPNARTILVVDATQKMTTLLRAIEALHSTSGHHRWDAFMVTRWDLAEDWDLVEQIYRLTQSPLLGISTSPRFDVPLMTRDLSFAHPPPEPSPEISF